MSTCAARGWSEGQRATRGLSRNPRLKLSQPGTMTEATMGDGGGGGGDERRVAANEERNAPQRERCCAQQVPQREIYREKSPSSFVWVLGLIARAGTMRRGAVGSKRMGGA
ncbi:unnamed protein product [Lampetra planeri]